MNKEYAIVIGHNRKSKGATSKFVEPEFDFNKKVAGHLSDICDIYEYEDYSGGYTNMVKKVANEMNKKSYKLVIELHYNSVADTKANGTEAVYYYKSDKGLRAANLFIDLVTKATGTKARRPVPAKNNKDRGFAAVYYPKAPAIIAEPFFGSNESDSKIFANRHADYAEILRTVFVLSY